MHNITFTRKIAVPGDRLRDEGHTDAKAWLETQREAMPRVGESIELWDGHRASVVKIVHILGRPNKSLIVLERDTSVPAQWPEKQKAFFDKLLNDYDEHAWRHTR